MQHVTSAADGRHRETGSIVSAPVTLSDGSVSQNAHRGADQRRYAFIAVSATSWEK